MKSENPQSSARPHGPTVRFEGHVINEEFARSHGFDLATMERVRMVAVGYDGDGNVAGIVPVILNGLEESISKQDLQGFNQILSQAAELARTEAGL